MSRLNFAANLSLMYTEVPLIERFAAAAATGFARVEIQFPYELSADAICEQLTTARPTKARAQASQHTKQSPDVQRRP